MAANVVHNLIVQLARKYGIDPAAVLAVANVEGGVHYGEVGDKGTSFGPFQLHVGGALPKGRGAAWANSPAGLEYAVAQMAPHAKGLTGKDAVSAIVTNFERPAAPGAEIQKAWGGYQQFAKGATGKIPAGVSPTVQGGPSAMGGQSNLMDMFQQSARQQVLQQAMQLAQTGDTGAFSQGLLGLAQQRQMFAAADAQFGNQPTTASGGATPPSIDPHGTIDHPAQLVKGEGTGSVKLAAQQIGQPYVWGGESRAEGGFDCSGLIDWTMRQQGYKGPRITTQTALHMGVSVKKDQIQPGDWIIANNGEHMVMYAGNGKVIAAPHTGTVVQYQPLNKFTNITDIRRVGV